MSKKYEPQAYRAIRAWGNMVGSFSSYITNEQQRASNENAPLNAVYARGSNNWATIEDIKSIDTVKTLATYLARQ